MRLASTLRNPAFLTASLAASFIVLAEPAHACQLCAVTISYNIFRFAGVWYYLFFIWLIAALIAGLTFRKTAEQKVSRLLFARSSLKLLIVAAVLILLGLNLAAMLYLPFILLPFSFPHRFRKKKNLHITELTPVWLHTVSRILLAVAVLSIVPSYFLIPKILNEPDTRSMVSRTREDLKSLAAMINEYHSQISSYPPMLPIRHDQEVYTRLDTQELSKVRFMENEITHLLDDPFAFHLMSCPLAAGTLFPGYFSDEDMFIRGSRGMFKQIQYYQNSSGFVLWGRGPDTVFSPQLVDAFTSDGLAGLLPGPVMLTTVTYDPTNGTFGPGDIFYTQQH